MSASTTKNGGWLPFSFGSSVTKLTCLILFVTYLLILFSIILSKFRTEDPIPHLVTVSAEERRFYKNFSALIRSGLYIKSFPTFDFMKNKFAIDGVLWFEFKADEVMLETIERFSIENGKILYLSPKDVRLYDDKIFVQYNLIFELKADLDYRRFPFEDHRLSIILSNNFISANEMYFDDAANAVSFSLDKGIFIPNWTLLNTRAQTGVSSFGVDTYDEKKKTLHPKIVFGMDFRKGGIKKIIVLLVPIFTAGLFSLLAFLMRMSNVVGRFRLTVSSVTALLGYRFVMEAMSPKVGYFTIADSLFMFLFFMAFFNFVFQVMLIRMWSAISDGSYKPSFGKERIILVDTIAFYFWVLCTFLVATYVITS